MKQYSPNSNIIITTYPCIYLYIQQLALLWFLYFTKTYKLHIGLSIPLRKMLEIQATSQYFFLLIVDVISGYNL